MKQFTLLLIGIIFLPNTIFAQLTETESNDIYPGKYTFEMVEEYQKKGEIEKSIWFLINLYPENKSQVVKKVKEFSKILDTVNMENLLKISFTTYIPFDPQISSFENGVLILDETKLKQKGAFVDELTLEISTSDNSVTSASDYNLRGLEKANSGNYKGAIDDFTKAIDIEPTGQFYFNRAYSKSLNGDYLNAIKDFDKNIEFNYRIVDGYYERGYCKLLEKNPKAAIEDFNKVIEIEPNGKAYYYRGYSKSEIGEFNDAIQDYNEAIKFNYNLVDTYLERGYCKTQVNNPEGAIIDYSKVLEINNKFALAYFNRGAVKFAIGDKSGACNDWKKAVDLGYEQVFELIKENCD